MLAELAAQARIVHVIGTTGFDAESEARITGGRAPCRDRQVRQYEPGRESAGGAGGARRQGAARLRYRDAGNASPDESGCAVRHRACCWATAAAKGRGIALDKHSVRSRDGHNLGPRKDGDIGFATLRGGTVVGEHEVILAGPGERITLSPYGRRPLHLRPWRADRGTLGPWQEARPLWHDGCAGPVMVKPSPRPRNRRVLRAPEEADARAQDRTAIHQSLYPAGGGGAVGPGHRQVSVNKATAPLFKTIDTPRKDGGAGRRRS